MNLKTAIAGYFHIEKKKRSTGESNFRSGKCKNRITNIGLDQMGSISSGGAFNSCVVGSGSSLPSNGDLWLDTFVARTTSRMSGSPVWTFHNEDPDYFVRCVTRWQFGEGVAAGNLSEVGMAWGSTEGSLFCRALIVDALGNPTTITVLPDEFLEVTYTHEYYLDLSDDVGQIVLDGVTYDYVCRFGGVFSNWGNSATPVGNKPNTVRFGQSQFGAGSASAIDITPATDPLGESTNSNTSDGRSLRPYVPGSYERIQDLTWLLGQGNVSGGIKRIIFPMMSAQGASAANHNLTFYAQCGFTPPIPKNNTRILRLGMRSSWGRKDDA